MLTRLLLLAGACLFFAAPHAHAQDNRTIEEVAAMFARLPQGDAAEVSPDGSTIAMLQSPIDSDERFLVFYDIASGAQNAIPLGEAKVRNVVWANNNRLLIYVSQTMENTLYDVTVEVFRVLAIDRDGSNPEWLFDDRKFSYTLAAPRIVHLLPDDPDHVLMAQWDAFSGFSNLENVSNKQTYDEMVRYTVYRVDVNTGRLKRLAAGDENTVGWVADSDGDVRLRVDYRDGLDLIDIFTSDKNLRAFERIASFHAPDGYAPSASVAGFAPDDETIYVFALNGKGRDALFILDRSTGELGAEVWSDDVYDVGSGLIQEGTRAVIGVSYTEDLDRYVYFDEALASLQAKLKKAFGGLTVNIISASHDESVVLASVEAKGEPVSKAFYNADTRAANFFANAYPEVAAAGLFSTVERFDYKASDGLGIPGYLTLPKTPGATPPPLVVLPHGGPASRDSASFDWWSQFYAARGFAVYQPNFRGSEGFGTPYQRAGDGEWGARMQADIDEGVRALIKAGRVDGKRICIVGGSYGGYAALAGGAFSGGLYKCVVAAAPVSDLPVMIQHLESERGRSSDSLAYWRRAMGVARVDVGAVSPARAARQFSAPVMLIHGRDDTVVPFEQSEIMERALKDAGKPVTLVEIEGEDHWFSRRSSRYRLLTESAAFIEASIGSAR